MNRYGENLASNQTAQTVSRPGAGLDQLLDTDVLDLPRTGAPLIAFEDHASAPPFGEIEGVLCSMARIVEQRDHHTAGHSERLAVLGVALGVAMRLDSASLQLLYVGGRLHDIGKVGIPDCVLMKPGKLTFEEWEVMRAHPAMGEEVCRPLALPDGVLPMVRNHHGRWDGTGYPDGLRGTAIPLLARVLQVVDIYDALTNPRPYKRAYSNARALEILREETDRGWRDQQIVSLFIRDHEQMPPAEAAPRVEEMGLGEIGNSLRNLQTHLAQ